MTAANSALIAWVGNTMTLGRGRDVTKATSCSLLMAGRMDEGSDWGTISNPQP